MLMSILILLGISVFLNLVFVAFLVRLREVSDTNALVLSDKFDKLTQELLTRLPPRPYGVKTEDRPADLTIGPVDSRIDY